MGDQISSAINTPDASSLAADASTLSPSQTSAAFAAASSAAGANGQAGTFAQAAGLHNASGLDYDAFVTYDLNSTFTGCYANGSLPVPLANSSICLNGWYCGSKQLAPLRGGRLRAQADRIPW